MRISDWSSDVCSSDLRTIELPAGKVTLCDLRHCRPDLRERRVGFGEGEAVVIDDLRLTLLVEPRAPLVILVGPDEEIALTVATDAGRDVNRFLCHVAVTLGGSLNTSAALADPSGSTAWTVGGWGKR